MDKKTNPLLNLPTSIIVASVLIAGSIIWSNKPEKEAIVDTENQKTEKTVAPVTKEDHILGNPNAPIKIVEYSDASCPFCKSFHPTMKKIIEEYGPSGNVAWVYRHFPLNKPRSDGFVLHPNAGNEAEAMECADALGGNDAFWKFTNRLYEVTPAVTSATPNGLDQKLLPQIAKEVGLDPVSFNECLTSDRFAEKVEKDYISGINAGVSGTPYSIAISNTGKSIPINGALPYANVKAIVDSLLIDIKK
jgi:protein-disulfide isomerase